MRGGGGGGGGPIKLSAWPSGQDVRRSRSKSRVRLPPAVGVVGWSDGTG